MDTRVVRPSNFSGSQPLAQEQKNRIIGPFCPVKIMVSHTFSIISPPAEADGSVVFHNDLT
jgi:hypothetical protein